MNLLTKSNLRKSRGTSIGLALLILTISLILSMVLIIIFDFQNDINKQKDRLNPADTSMVITSNVDGIDEDFVKNTLPNDYISYEYTEGLSNHYDVKFAKGTMTPIVFISSFDRIKNRAIEQYEIVLEDTSIKDNYIYLPYHFNTGGGLNLGDDFVVKMPGKDYTYTIKGFINIFNLGSVNNGSIIVILDEEELLSLYDLYPSNKAINIDYKLKEDVNPDKFNNKIANEVKKINSKSILSSVIQSTSVLNRTYISTVLIVSFVGVSVILVIVIALMLINVISNYIRENMKSIGVLKSLGYTSNIIKRSFYLQFLIISILASLLGSALVYTFMPVIGNLLQAQYGMPYHVSFTLLAHVICILFILAVVGLSVLLSTRKINKIEPIVALKDGIEIHTFKKNFCPLDKIKWNLNIRMALKSLFTNIRQHMITFVAIFFLTFSGVIAAVMVENFGVHLKLSLLTFETCSCAISCDDETKDQLYEYLNNREDVYNNKYLVQIYVTDDDYSSLLCYIIDDVDKLNNKEVCYQGRLPKYDNEIAVSGKYAKESDVEIGEEITLCYGESEAKYLVTGFVQTTNNSGHEAILSVDAFQHILNLEHSVGYYWVDTTEDINILINDVKEQFGNHILSTLIFEDALSGASTLFRAISMIMLVVIIIITGIVILLVLYLLIKTLIHKKRYEYGILKTLGYTSNDLMLQNAVSFMPSIIISTVISSIISPFIANPYLGIILSNFGIMKCMFNIPVLLVILLGLFQILISFGFALILSRKIKKLEPYSLLMAE